METTVNIETKQRRKEAPRKLRVTRKETAIIETQTVFAIFGSNRQQTRKHNVKQSIVKLFKVTLKESSLFLDTFYLLIYRSL